MTSGRPRLDKLEIADLDADQRALYDAIAGGPRAQGRQLFALVDEAGRLEGPFNAMLLSPAVGSALQSLGGAVRFGSHLSDRCREIAILVVAHHAASDFEIYAHEPVGRACGLTDAELDLLRADSDAALDGFADPVERTTARTARALATRGDLTDDEYALAEERLGEACLFELTTLVGYYATLALQLRVYRVPAPS